MMEMIIPALLGFIVGAAVIYFYMKQVNESKVTGAKHQANAIVEEAKREADALKKEIINTAKKIFGITNNINEAGFILPNGEMLNFSEEGEEKDISHFEIGGNEKMRNIDVFSIQNFEETVAIRIDAEQGLIEILNMPTLEQMKKISNIADYNGITYLEMLKQDKNKYNSEHKYIEIEKSNPAKIINQLRSFYENP